MHAMFGVVCFPELGRDTGPCETQIVVLSIVHEAQTQNYNVIVRDMRTNEKVLDFQNGYIYKVSDNWCYVELVDW